MYPRGRTTAAGGQRPHCYFQFTQASVDGHLDANGKLLLQLAEDLDLVIVNLGPQW